MINQIPLAIALMSSLATERVRLTIPNQCEVISDSDNMVNIKAINYGNDVVTITDSCNIVSTSVLGLSGLPLVLAPGETKQFSIRIKPRCLSGRNVIQYSVSVKNRAQVVDEIPIQITTNVIKNTECRPYNILISDVHELSESCAAFSFTPSSTSGKFVSAELDSGFAPVTARYKISEHGEVMGTVELDTSKLRGGNFNGNVKLVGTTENGVKNHITIEWIIKH